MRSMTGRRQPSRSLTRVLSEKICAAVIFSGPLVTLSESNADLDERGVLAMLARTCWCRCGATYNGGGKVDNTAIVNQLNPDG